MLSFYMLKKKKKKKKKKQKKNQPTLPKTKYITTSYYMYKTYTNR